MSRLELIGKSTESQNSTSVLNGDNFNGIKPKMLEWALKESLRLSSPEFVNSPSSPSAHGCTLDAKQHLNAKLVMLRWSGYGARWQDSMEDFVKQFDFNKVLEADEKDHCAASQSGSLTIVGDGWIMKSEDPRRLKHLEDHVDKYVQRLGKQYVPEKSFDWDANRDISHIMRLTLAFTLKCGKGPATSWTIFNNLHPNPRKELMIGFYDVKPSREKKRCHNQMHTSLSAVLAGKKPGQKGTVRSCAGFLGDFLGEVVDGPMRMQFASSAVGPKAVELRKRIVFLQNLQKDFQFFHNHPDKLVDYSLLIFLQERDESIAGMPNVFEGGRIESDPHLRPLQIVVGVIDFLKPKSKIESRLVAMQGKSMPFGQYKFQSYSFFSFCIATRILDSKGTDPYAKDSFCNEMNGELQITWRNPKPDINQEFCALIAACRGNTYFQVRERKGRFYDTLEKCSADGAAGN